MYGMLRNLSNDDSYYSFIDLSWNHFEGTLPFMSSSPGGIDLSYNLFSGSIHNFLCNSKHKEDENLNTEIINLKDNFLEGEIPDCWLNWTSVRVVELSNNRFSGKIPESIGYLGSLEMLNLRNNELIGNLSQQGWNQLSVLDLGENKLIGEFLSWIGKDLEWLSILVIRGNKFFSHIPEEVCNLVYLQILDVSNNDLNGTIPTCVNRLFGIFEKTLYLKSTFSWQYGAEMEYTGSTSIVRKGVLVEYSTILNFVQSLDLSNNNFVGEIPEGITNLSGLQSLNLSHNFLTGKIPENISAMRKLESLDLSQNQLYGDIPQSMSTMNFLNTLNLSYNNLLGQIPSGTQLQSFSSSSFIGNKLCGPPLVKACRSNGALSPSYHSSESGRVDWFHFYVSLGVGFVVGFWCVTGPLVFYRKWRISYFRFLQLLWDKIWVWFHLHNVRVRNHGS